MHRRLRFPACATLLALILSLLTFAGDNPPKSLLTDIMKPEQFKKCGLQKLDRVELEALNVWIVETYAALAAASEKAEGEIAVYDQTGTAIAYIVPKDEMTIYLWSGLPVAYLNKSNVYGMNGHHLGWYERGLFYDKHGKTVGITEDLMKKLKGIEAKAPGAKGIKKIIPIKGIEQIEPIQPILMPTWSDLELKMFLLQGEK